MAVVPIANPAAKFEFPGVKFYKRPKPYALDAACDNPASRGQEGTTPLVAGPARAFWIAACNPLCVKGFVIRL